MIDQSRIMEREKTSQKKDQNLLTIFFGGNIGCPLLSAFLTIRGL